MTTAPALLQGVLLDVTPSWWRDVHRCGGESPVALAVQIVFVVAEEQDLAIVEMYVGSDTLRILVDAETAALESIAQWIVRRIEEGITLDENDRIQRAPETRVSRKDLEQKLEACGFESAVAEATVDAARSVVWALPSGSMFVQLSVEEDDDHALYGSAEEGDPGTPMTYAAVLKKLTTAASRAAAAASVPGNVLEARGG